MDCASKRIGQQLAFGGYNDLAQHLGRMRSDDVDAKQPMIGLIDDDLDEPLAFARRPCPTQRPERKSTDENVIASFLRFLLS